MKGSAAHPIYQHLGSAGAPSWNFNKYLIGRNGEIIEHFDSRVLMVDVSNDHKIDAFVSVPFPVGIAYGPDGDFYAASFTDSLDNILKIFDFDFEGAKGKGSVQRFDGITGKPKGTVISGMPFAGFLAFV